MALGLMVASTFNGIQPLTIRGCVMCAIKTVGLHNWQGIANEAETLGCFNDSFISAFDDLILRTIGRLEALMTFHTYSLADLHTILLR